MKAPTRSPLAPEFRRRLSLEDALFYYVLEHPRVWIHGRDMRPIAGDAWRSRVTQVRRRLADLGLTFAWNRKNGGQAAYMLRARPLGRDASPPLDQPGLFS